MQKYLSCKEHSQITHLVNMQHLLDQYDRENKHLNKQVLQLLAENKALKFDIIREKSHNKTTNNNYKQPTRQQGRIGGDNIISRWKKQQEKENTHHKNNPDKIDQAVQAEISIEGNLTKKMSEKQTENKATGSEIFSFGENTHRSQEEKEKKQSAKPSERYICIERIHQEDQLEMTAKKKLATEQATIESSPIVRIMTEQTMEQSKAQNDSFEHKKRSRSSHSLLPSRPISSASLEKRHIESKEQNKGKQKSFIQLSSNKYSSNFYSAEKKRFLQVISKTQTPFDCQRAEKTFGCCL